MSKPSISNPEIWSRIDKFDLKNLGEGTFFEKLVNDNRWSHRFTRRAIKEYKKFIYLAVVSKATVAPSKIVDKVWHLHLSYTHDYWDNFCPKILGKSIHHNPSKRNSVAKVEDKINFQATMQLYQKEFGKFPPKMIWNCRLRSRIKLIHWCNCILLFVLGFINVIPLDFVVPVIVILSAVYSFIMGSGFEGWGGDDNLFDFTDCGSCSSSDGCSSCGGD